jgi:pSer/pThr/pTyr-binding forkhead associated (FHA) protein
MAKLVILTQGLNGRAHELNVDRTTIGRVEDNLFQIAESSVSSHHCEVLLRGSDVVIKDLNSTNGTFINGEQITESVLKPGQTLRLRTGRRASHGLRSRPGQKAGGIHHGHPARRQLE